MAIILWTSTDKNNNFNIFHYYTMRKFLSDGIYICPYRAQFFFSNQDLEPKLNLHGNFETETLKINILETELVPISFVRLGISIFFNLKKFLEFLSIVFIYMSQRD